MGNQWSSTDTLRTALMEDGVREDIALRQLLDDAQYLLQLSSDRHSRQARDLSRLLEHARRTLHPAFFPVSPPVRSLGLPVNRERSLSRLAVDGSNTSAVLDGDHCRSAQSIVSDTTPVKDLGMLLDDERYLLLVLDHLVDYGLQECRLVCKTWYEACKNFPISLGSVTQGSFQMAARGFPQAVSLSIELSDCDGEFDKWSERLCVFQNLRHLELQLSMSRPSECLRLLTQPLQRLKKLDLALQDSVALMTLYLSLPYLTKLTMLGIETQYRVRSLDRMVFVGIGAIQELTVPVTQFINTDGSRRFPGLTNLTRLNISPWRAYHDRDMATRVLPNPRLFYALFLHALVPHASTLQSLSLYIWLEHKAIDFSPLLLLTRLKSFKVDIDRPTVFSYFQKTLDRMNSLESYSIHCRLISTAFSGSNLLISYSQNSIAVDAQIMTLCESTLADYSGDVSCSFCTSSKIILHAADLLDSSIPFWRENTRLMSTVKFRLSTGSNGEANGFTGIEHLTLKYTRLARPLMMKSWLLRGIEDLQSLSIEGIDSDKFFFQELAALSKLTSLHLVLSNQPFILRATLTDVSLLTNLHELTIRSPKEDEVVETSRPKHLPQIDRFQLTFQEKEHRFTKKTSSSSLRQKDQYRASHWLSRSN